MAFFKKRIDLSSLITMIATEVLKVPDYTYGDYLTHEPDSILSEQEFAKFVKNIPLLRLLLIYAMLRDSQERGQLKISIDDLAQCFSQSLGSVSYGAVVDENSKLSLAASFTSELDLLNRYIDNLPEKNSAVKGFTPYACLYFTSKFAETIEESVKNGVYIALINTQRKLMKEYFYAAIDNVKITL